MDCLGKSMATCFACGVGSIWIFEFWSELLVVAKIMLALEK